MPKSLGTPNLGCLPSRIGALVLACPMLIPIFVGCDPTKRFPQAPLGEQSHEVGQEVAYDTNGDKEANYWQVRDETGRVVVLKFDDNGDSKTDETVDLRTIAAGDVPHLILALDGCPYDCVDEVYRAGGLRLFHQPARMISTFPAMTDVALSRIWQCGPCRAYEALYFDRGANRLNNGNAAYLRAENSPWVAMMSYRCSFWWDVLVYLNPQLVFDHEMRNIYRAFAQVEQGSAAGYTVGTAGLGTRGGKPAIITYLHRVDRLCQQIVYERRGRVKLSVLADHGQGLRRCKRVSFKQYLARRGLNLTKHLKAPNDVVTVEYGLVTYASFSTNMQHELVEALRRHEAVELVFRKDGNNVIVLNQTERAAIIRAENGYRYEMIDGDPLKLGPIIKRLSEQGHVSADQVIDDRTLLEATAAHDYPDPLHRAWWAFNGVTDVCPDVIASLRNGHSHGGAFFDAMIGGAASTHGSIDRLSSTSFVLTMRGPLPEVLRAEDALKLLENAGLTTLPARKQTSSADRYSASSTSSSISITWRSVSSHSSL